jgi:hypothetical protein
MMEKISSTDRVRNEEVFDNVTDDRSILHRIKIKIGNWASDVLRNCILKHVTEGKIETKTEVKGRRRKRRKHLLDDLKLARGYGKLKEEALDRTMWGSHFGRSYGPVVKTDYIW